MLKAYATLYNAELMIEPCLRAAMKVFPDIEVIDVGSEDSGPEIAERLGARVTKLGRLDATEYVFMKEEWSRKSKHVIWIDADEVWPEKSILHTTNALLSYDLVSGFWRNLEVKDDKIMCSDYTHRGCVAWNTEKFLIHRSWPREKMKGRDESISRDKSEYIPEPENAFCWHGVLLNLSTFPEKKNRWKKRAERSDSFSSLEWTELSELPFKADPKVLEPAKFTWYR